MTYKDKASYDSVPPCSTTATSVIAATSTATSTATITTTSAATTTPTGLHKPDSTALLSQVYDHYN